MLTIAGGIILAVAIIYALGIAIWIGAYIINGLLLGICFPFVWLWRRIPRRARQTTGQFIGRLFVVAFGLFSIFANLAAVVMVPLYRDAPPGPLAVQATYWLIEGIMGGLALFLGGIFVVAGIRGAPPASSAATMAHMSRPVPAPAAAQGAAGRRRGSASVTLVNRIEPRLVPASPAHRASNSG